MNHSIFNESIPSPLGMYYCSDILKYNFQFDELFIMCEVCGIELAVRFLFGIGRKYEILRVCSDKCFIMHVLREM